MTNEKLHEEFKKELKTLLKKYNAEICLEDFGQDFKNEKIVVDFNSEVDGDHYRPYSQIIFGSYID